VTVSVVIATYNRGRAIARTLESVLQQTRPPDEVIVSDDGSTDGTAAWIRSHFPRVRVETFPNGGTSAARNRGAAAARGDVLVFIDHDDEMLPHAIETLLDLLRRFPEARAAYADHTYRNVSTGTFIPNHHSSIAAFERMRSIVPIRSDGDARQYGRPMYYALLHGNLLQQPWAIYRESFASLGGFDAEVRYCEDWELFMRVAARVNVAVTDRVISHHIVDGTNLHLRPDQDAEHMRVLRKHIRLAGWRDRRAALTLRRRLAMYHKTAGDRLRPHESRQSWKEYRRSLTLWPFDYVVAARCVLWAPAALRTRRRQPAAAKPA
jgi:glycosyltransferase involved in cell wall biosynthesis